MAVIIDGINVPGINLRTKGWTNLAEYPRLGSEADDTARINRALASLSPGGSLLFSGGILTISTPLVVSTKNVQLFALEQCTIKATVAMEACIKLDAANSATINYGVHIHNISFDGNNLANYCVLVEDKVGLYVSDTKITNCSFFKAVLDGVKVGAPAWVIKIDNCNSEYNGRDGVRIATNGTKQTNAVQVTNCLINNNTGNGITLNGIIQLIKGNDIEGNYYGVSINPSAVDLSGTPNNAYNIIVEDNYIELNKQAEIHVKSTSSGQVNGITIQKNYMWSNVVGGSGSLVIFEGALNSIVKLKFVDNTSTLDGTNVTKILNANNSLGTDSDVGTIITPSHYTNLGLAKATWYNYKVIPIAANLIQNGAYDLTQKSVNILPLTPKKIVFGLPGDIASKLVRSMNVYVETDSTNYTIRCKAIVKDLTTGVIVKQTQNDVAKTSGGIVTFNILNNWSYERRVNTEYLYFEFEVLSNTNGTSLYFHVPYLEMSH